MAQLFSGYAQQRGFKPISTAGRSRAIVNSPDLASVRSMEQARQLDRNNAVNTHEMLQEQFRIDQQARQTFLDLETQAANLERNAKMEKFNNEIERMQIEAKERTQLYESLAGISSTAADILVKENEKRKKAQLELSQNLVLQYGLNGQEVQELQSLEGGLLDYEAQQTPLIHRLRQQGASEADINTLMQSSGWNSYGAALGVVQNAGRNYDLYLTSKQDEDVTINGVPMSLASAEAQGDVAAIAGIFDRHRMNYLREYLPGFDPAFVAKHAREPMQQAESRRKRSLSTRIEATAREGNRAKEKQNLAIELGLDGTQPEQFMKIVRREAGGLDSDTLGTVFNRKTELLTEMVKDGVIDPRFAEGILSSNVFAKQFGREARFTEAFPVKAAALKAAIQEQDDERLRIQNNAVAEEKRRGQQLTQAIIAEFTSDPSTMTIENITAAQRAVLKTGNLDGANKLAKLIPHSTEKTNDKEFDSYWTKQKALGNFPTNEDIVFGGLSDTKMTAELQQRKAFEETGLTTDVVKNIDKRIESLLRTQLGEAYGNTQRVLPESYYAAFNAAKQQVLQDFRVAYKGPQTGMEAEQYAIGELKKELQKENGQYKVNVIGEATKDRRGKSKYKFDPGFTNFMGIEPIKKESSLPAIVDAHANGTEAFRNELFVDSGRVKNIVSNLNSGVAKPYPSEFFAINKSLKGKVPMSEIILAQIDQARKEDPTIPELKPEVKSIFQKAEKIVSPDILNIIQRYSTPATVDRGLISSDIPAIYDRSNPYVTFGRMLESVGVEEEYIPLFGAIMMGESGGRPGIDTVKSGLDVSQRNEYSIGLLQVNTQAHADKLRKLGYTFDDLRNPVKNLEVAMLVWEEWTNVLIQRGVPPEEAKRQALDRWGAYSNGSYRNYLPEATAQWERYKQQKNLPTWQQSSHMHPAAQRWVEQNGGAWIG